MRRERMQLPDVEKGAHPPFDKPRQSACLLFLIFSRLCDKETASKASETPEAQNAGGSKRGVSLETVHENLAKFLKLTLY
mmetsp:Transcript_17746/g.26042  ORF Transcript_17746/g.26042 Transcript_17746/m.26042 type:complete len:80 (-) Transcript_17746:442-681(-)